MTTPAELPAALTEDAIAAACNVLQAVVDLPVEQYESSPHLRKLRQAVGPLLARSLGRTYDGAGAKGRDRDAARRAHRRQANRHRQQGVAAERAAADRSALRAQRLARLAASASEGAAPRIADGPATMPAPVLADGGDGGAAWSLACCYACRSRFPANSTHAFYGAAFCPACAALNFRKRTQTGDLRGRGALVTGARVKIGFRVALKLLRAGATVVATSRFPADCARRFANEKDADQWRDRLRVVGCDFRDLGGVEALCSAVPGLLGCSLDILVNNACQTIRRPPQYYAETVRREAKLRRAIGNASLPILEGPATDDTAEPAGVALMRAWTASAPSRSDPALRALLCVAPGDDVRDDAAFPAGLTDANLDNNEQLDLRRENSWTAQLEDVSTPELAEVFAINALAPFVINSKLVPGMKRGASDKRRRFVVNVSAMEGKFYRQKQPTHPHTNMAKAALNMMTKTTAPALAEAHVYMTAVDTGWVNDEKPNHLAADHAARHRFQTPIDEVDAASRILDPVFCGLVDTPVFGVFLKDYGETEW
jgi:NAD(P)-dependent dehydrogenase (short-subunit alcohol dehydrogenase family)